MITRYQNNIMKKIWSEQSKFEALLEVEIKCSEAFMNLGVVPKDDYDKINEKATFSIDRVLEIEKETRHDVVAFTRAVSETLGEEKKWIHYGLTSTDVVDTAYGILYKRANDVIYKKITEFRQVLKEKAILYKDTPCIGRTHGVHADITSFGLKYALWYEEFTRHIDRFNSARKDVEAGKISGAVGNFANIDPYVQDFVCEKLGLESSKISTQILQRDRHANYFSTIALIGSSMEKIANEIRHLQRTEVREVEESFSNGQKGSSAMPHKRNPISSENISGCARVLRGYMVTAFENINLWHERDISHSSTERIIAQDSTSLLEYMLSRYTKVLNNLVVNEEQMLKNINLTNKVIYSQRVMNALIEEGLSREESYDMIQPYSMKAWKNNLDFQQLILDSKDITDVLSVSKINSCFSLDYYLKNVNTILKRVGIL